ncbi:MAG TPA: hypothetical protein PL016_03085, partial [Kiritimatiellia bacterium]|nr:hypothetical protein [Kiritimatiellia bacterium]
DFPLLLATQIPLLKTTRHRNRFLLYTLKTNGILMRQLSQVSCLEHVTVAKATTRQVWRCPYGL